MPNGGAHLVSFLESQGVRHLFTVPGESFVAVLDALHDSSLLAPVTCRNESGAAMMAEATGRLSSRPGVAFVTRGPGATNALAGVYAGHQAGSPMLLLVGLPPSDRTPHAAFQDIDLKSLFSSVCKWCEIVPSASEIEDHLRRAFRIAMLDRPGPVVLGFPENILSAELPPGPRSLAMHDPVIDPRPLTAEKLAHVRVALAHAHRPLVIAGSSIWSPEASRDLLKFAESFDLPVMAAFRRQDHADNRHRCYVGHAGLTIEPALAAALRDSDCIVSIGADLNDVTTQSYTLIDPGDSQRRLIHIAGDAGDPAAPYKFARSLAASPILAVEALSKLNPPRTIPWTAWRRDLRTAYEASLKPAAFEHKLQLDEVILTLSRHLPDDAIICNGAGNYAAFLHRYFTYKCYPSCLAPASGSMGYGLPAAIAAKLAQPARRVVALAGDGCFQMTSQELATAAGLDLAIILIIANNGSLGTIRMHQEMRYPGRVVATTLVNPDFCALADSYGARAERVTSTSRFASALHRALTANQLYVIELAQDIDMIAPGKTLHRGHLD